MLREYNEMKEEIKNPKNAVEHMETYSVSCKKKILQTKIQMSEEQNGIMFLSNCAALHNCPGLEITNSIK